MAIGRKILSGLFGATAGGLSGFAQQKAEERARMQRQMEREEERAYQRGLTAEARRYQEALAAREALMRGHIVAARQLAPEPEAEVATPESTAETLKSFITGARMGGAGVGLARGATDAAPFGPLASPDYDAPAISEEDRRDIRSVGGLGAAFRRQPEPLRAEYAQPETAAPERQAIELAGEKYEIVTPAERRARELEAERGGLDAIDVARLREVARGSQASPEREGARAALSDIGVSYRTEEETRAIERAERLEDLAAAGDRRVLELAFETLSKANLASLEESKNVLPIDLQAQLVAPLLKAGGLPEEMTESVLRAFAAMSTTPAPSAGEGGGAGTQSPPSLPDVIAQAQRARSGIPELKISLEDFITNILPDIEEVDRELEENSIISQRLLSRGPHGDYRGALSPEELRFSNALPKANRDLLAYRNKLINDVGGREAFEYLNQMVRTRRISGPS